MTFQEIQENLKLQKFRRFSMTVANVIIDLLVKELLKEIRSLEIHPEI